MRRFAPMLLVTLAVTTASQAQEPWQTGMLGLRTLVPASPSDSFESHPAPPVTSIMTDAEQNISSALDELHDWNLDKVTIRGL